MPVRPLYLLAVAATLACASTAGTSGKAAASPRNILTAEEIGAAHADINTAYDAIARLRSNWLAPHGAGGGYAKVYIDGQQMGDGELGSLRNIQAFHVANIRYYDVTQAGARFGLRGGDGGVIEVTTGAVR